MYIPILSAVLSGTRQQTEQKALQVNQKRSYFHAFYILLLGSLLLSFNSQAASYTWNGSVSTDWNTATNWTPAAVPASTDDITINTVSVARYPVLMANTTTNNFTLNITGTTAIVNLGGFTLTCNGTTTINAGKITNGSLLIQGTNTSFGTSGYPVIDVRLTVVSPVITNIQNTTFQKPVSITKNGGYDESANGNNIFQDSVSLNLTGGLRWTLARLAPDTFNGPLSITANKPNLNYGLNINKSNYNGNIVLNSIYSGITLVGTLAAGKKLQYGVVGTGTYVTLSNFVSLTTEPITIELPTPVGTTAPGGGQLTLENCVFYGDVRLAAFQIYYKGCTFFRRAILQKSTYANGVPNTGRVSDWTTSWIPTANTPTPVPNPVNTGSDGVVLNTFHGPVYILGGAWIISGWGNAAIRSVFNEEVTVNNSTNGYNFYISANTTADVFNKKLILTGSGSNMRFGANGAITTIPEGVILDATGLYGGLQLEKIVFKGTTERQLTLTGTTPAYFGTGFVSEGPLTVTAPHLYFNGGKFLKPSTFTKTVAGDNISTGGCVFTDKALIRNRASSGTIQMATQVKDQTVKSQ
ncbi:hypothetical protein QNI19_12250 [Cytophagaceae bacterium DM2B3-1]|uniref:G8 domain-containing protein n=1 Tax=Xanthocytophaga flava TaxID=3048013 RepID=A0ABT7CJ31_9BACT|nr:hypothetical protein [Xanthocytophaga flavus]MDJ1493705.1 hypothetical protein [Xanthocytophaga flavus]